MAQLVNFMAKTFFSMPTSKPYHLRNISMIFAKVEKNVGNNTKPPIKGGAGGQTNKNGPSLTKSDQIRGDASGKAEGDDAKTVSEPIKIQ